MICLLRPRRGDYFTHLTSHSMKLDDRDSFPVILLRRHAVFRTPTPLKLCSQTHRHVVIVTIFTSSISVGPTTALWNGGVTSVATLAHVAASTTATAASTTRRRRVGQSLDASSVSHLYQAPPALGCHSNCVREGSRYAHRPFSSTVSHTFCSPPAQPHLLRRHHIITIWPCLICNGSSTVSFMLESRLGHSTTVLTSSKSSIKARRQAVMSGDCML
jgi:hypothetical protein